MAYDFAGDIARHLATIKPNRDCAKCQEPISEGEAAIWCHTDRRAPLPPINVFFHKGCFKED